MQTDLFDVPVYRLREERYNKEMDEYIERTMYPPGAAWSEGARSHYARYPDSRIAYQDQLWRSYGGMWRYNEIVGYLRLHLLGSQIRGEYVSSITKRATRTRKKTFTYRTHKFSAELSIPYSPNSQQIFDLIREYLDDCERGLGGRYLDRSMFDAVAPYIDWQRLYSDHLKGIERSLT